MNVELQDINYSLKDIPIPTKTPYLKTLIQKTEYFLKRIRWNAFLFDNPDLKSSKETYGFPTQRTPPQNLSLIPFEEDMYSVIRSIEFRNVNNLHLTTLAKDVDTIKSSDSVFVKADKTSNIYKIEKQPYQKVLYDNITKNYKKADEGLKENIDTTVVSHIYAYDRAKTLSFILLMRRKSTEFENESNV